MFNIAIYNNVKDVKPTLVPIDDFKNLPSGAEDKSNSKLWSPVPLTVRKKVVNQKVNISALTFDYDFDNPPNIKEYKYYRHKTHRGRWRIIVPLDRTIPIYHQEYVKLYELVASVLNLPKSIDKETEGFDKQTEAITTMFFLPPPGEVVTLENASGRVMSPVYVPTKELIHDSNAGFIPKSYPPINDDLILKLRRLHKIFKNDVKSSLSFLSKGKSRFPCYFHKTEMGGSPREIAFNVKPFYLYSYHESCDGDLRNILKLALPSDSKISVEDLSYTEVYLLSGIHREMWDIHMVERMYIGPYLYDRFANVVELTGEVAIDTDRVLNMTYGDRVVYSIVDNVFYAYDEEAKVYSPLSIPDIGVTLTTEIYRWLAYRFDKFRNNKGANMVDQRAHLIDKIRARRMGKVKLVNALALKNGNLELKEENNSLKAIFHKDLSALFAQSRLDYEYDPNADCPLFKSLLTQYFGKNSKSEIMLQEFFGYCLTDSRRYERYLLLYGVPRAGKGTISEVLQRLTGGGVTNLAKIHEPITRYSVHKHKVVICDEEVAILGSKKMVNAMKLLVSSGDIPARNNFAQEVSLKTFPKFVMTFNEPPDMDTMDEALRLRMLVINFTKTYAGKEDTRLKEKLKEEYPGILNWAIKGLERLWKQDKFSLDVKARDELVEQMRSDTDKFVQNFVDSLEPGKYTLKELFDDYMKLVIEEADLSLDPLPKAKFSKYIEPYFNRKYMSNGVVKFEKKGPYHAR